MHMKKLLAAALACCTALSSVPVMSVFAEGPAEATAPELLFDFRSDDSNEVMISTEALANGDQSVDVKLYVPSNPGINGASLKMQINDGEVGEDNLFGNYGFTMTSAKFSSPYCFDSENEGDSKGSFQPMFTADQMNLCWTYRYSQEENADSSSEAGKTSWDAETSWAYDRAFAEMTLNVPQGTPVGEYVLDIRRDTYINAVTLGANKQWPAKSLCTAADNESVDFKSVPLKIIVAEPETTTTTEETTTTESTTTTTELTTSIESTTTTEQTTSVESTTTTEQTTSVESTTTTEQTTSVESTTTTEQTTSVESTTTTEQTTSVESTTTTEQTTSVESTTTTTELTTAPVSSEPAETTTDTAGEETPDLANNYEGMAEGMYMVVGDASGAPGEKVKVPIYVYNDPGTAGMALYWVYSDGLTVNRITRGDAYLGSAQPSAKTVPISYVFTCPEGKDQQAADGAVICYITFVIPEDAADGKVYTIEWIEENGKTIPDLDKYSQAVNTDRVDNRATLFPGTITVNATGKARLNYESYSFAKKDEQVRLAVLGAKGTGLTWKSSDEAVATVDANGTVTAAADTGDCTIEASYQNGSGQTETLTCKIHIGLYGDVDGDGVVTAYDATLVLISFTEKMAGYEADERTLTPEQELIGDVDQDGTMTAFDATIILTYFSLQTAGFDDVTWYELVNNGNPNVPGAP